MSNNHKPSCDSLNSVLKNLLQTRWGAPGANIGLLLRAAQLYPGKDLVPIRVRDAVLCLTECNALFVL